MDGQKICDIEDLDWGNVSSVSEKGLYAVYYVPDLAIRPAHEEDCVKCRKEKRALSL